MATQMTPQQQQDYEQSLMNSVLSSLKQPAAQLQETQAATGAEGASAQASIESAQRTAQDIQLAQRQQQQQQFINDSQSLFDKNKQQTGYVSPDIYNTQKQKAAALGINADDFDKLYEHNYTDPTSIDYNTSSGFSNRNAYSEIKRQIQASVDQYNKIPDSQKGVFKSGAEQLIPGLSSILAPDALAYQASTAGFAGQLKGITGATRVTDAELSRWQNLLPSPRNSEEQNSKNLQILDAQLKATFNTHVGLDDKYLPKTQDQTTNSNDPSLQGFGQNVVKSGGDLLNNLLKTPNMVIANAQNAAMSGSPKAVYEATNPSMLLAGVIGNYGKSLYKDAGSPLQGGDVLGRILGNAYNNPVGVAADILPFLGLKGAGEKLTPIDEAPPTSETSSIPKAPGKLSQILNPQGAKDIGSQIRDAAVNAAQKNGASIPGDNIVTGVNKWADTAMKANPGDEAKIQATIDSVTKQYAGKQISPQDAVNIYNEIDSGFNRQGITKETIQGSRDQALRSIFSNELEKVAPGWKEGTSTIAKGFKAEKGQVAKTVKNLPYNASKAALNMVGFGLLRDILDL